MSPSISPTRRKNRDDSTIAVKPHETLGVPLPRSFLPAADPRHFHASNTPHPADPAPDSSDPIRSIRRSNAAPPAATARSSTPAGSTTARPAPRPRTSCSGAREPAAGPPGVVFECLPRGRRGGAARGRTGGSRGRWCGGFWAPGVVPWLGVRAGGVVRGLWLGGGTGGGGTVEGLVEAVGGGAAGE